MSGTRKVSEYKSINRHSIWQDKRLCQNLVTKLESLKPLEIDTTKGDKKFTNLSFFAAWENVAQALVKSEKTNPFAEKVKKEFFADKPINFDNLILFYAKTKLKADPQPRVLRREALDFADQFIDGYEASTCSIL